MKAGYILLTAAMVGLGVAIAAIVHDNAPATAVTQPVPSFQPPFDSYVAGAGIVEATTGDISIGTPVSGIVMEIYVEVGDEVKSGDPLFKIDDRALQAQLLTADARLEEARAALLKPTHRLENAEQLKQRDPNGISAQELTDLRDDVAQAEAALKLARAQLGQLRVDIARHVVRAPVAGEILQLKMRLGEFVEESSTAPPLLVLGGNDRMNLRVDVDEYDAWRVRPDAQAVAFVRGQPALKVPLRYEYTEPYVVPKTSLTGRSTERSDTRVLQVIYSFASDAFPVYAGQQLDVFIRTDDRAGAPP